MFISLAKAYAGKNIINLNISKIEILNNYF